MRLAKSMKFVIDGASTINNRPWLLPSSKPHPVSRTNGVSQWTVGRSAAK
ncbi:hypothetical protein SCATT_29130 [Streptantibioticus cattleyicolor NRRL 8057 = DSM 46488]|jgi:hypothetical protein|uniref:Uncharacterized protein n=1 Tax=Streptantibioticus cattleyicolor (strain ATCC 35852 / DSM 46488 / JCM 4925 / NBRC 14057 / NRRL 8057) TaxID=1003195 RepID=G8WQS0_STREN|nr:hypothetical protein SCATT_29130 [Streptantibioticus cattleyicolor NRRL 8057 = DSM 46488]